MLLIYVYRPYFDRSNFGLVIIDHMYIVYILVYKEVDDITVNDLSSGYIDRSLWFPNFL